MARNYSAFDEEEIVGGADSPRGAELDESETSDPSTGVRQGGVKKKVTFVDNATTPSGDPRQAGNTPTPPSSPRGQGDTTDPKGTSQDMPPRTPSPRRQTRQPTTPPATPPPLWGRRPRPTPLIEPTYQKGPLHTDNTSRLATSVLAKLQRPMPYTRDSTAWGPKDTEILDSNIALLRKVVSPPQIAGQKRRHGDLNDPYDSDSSDFRSSPERHSSRRDNEKHAKKKMRNHKVRVRPHVDLAVLAPQPLRIDYKSHPLEERSDQWFITMFNKLFQMCDTFARTFFDVHDLETGEFYEPWAEVQMSAEFIHWASQIAEEDPVMGGWDYVLRNSSQRRWMVMAILMRIIRVKIFDTDLWGANKEQCELLFGIERALLNREGFQRTELRSHAVRQILGLAPVTQNFYPETATLTAQVSLLFKPLADYLYSIPPAHDVPLPNFTNQYQALHNIISTAAYLSLCMRLSSTIFHINEPSLGEKYDPSDQWNLEMEYYTQSKERVIQAFKKKWDEWLVLQESAQQKLLKLEEEGEIYTKSTASLEDCTKRVLTKEYQKATREKLDVDERKPKAPGLMYRPMCKMSVWPVITRYKAGSDEDDENEKKGKKIKLQEKNGFRIFQISKAAVVSYFGEIERAGRVRLEEHVRVKRATKGKGLVGTVVMGSLAAAVLGVGYVLAASV